MKFAIFLLAIVATALAACPYTDAKAAQAELKSLSNEINSQNGSWSARVNERFHGMTFEQIKRQLGALKGGAKLPSRTHEESNVAVPDSWQAAEAFPKCKEVIETVVDQSACGSCWAMAVSSAASHRLCIKNNGKVTTQLSARDLLSCCSSCGFGCEGGYPSSAWSWLSSTGIVSGKNYNDFSKCVSYPFQPCGHHVDTFDPSCSTLDFSTPKCQKSCDDATSWPATYSEDKIKFTRAFGVYGEAAMQKELMANGPISVAFTVYSDFLNYKGGVYKKTSGSVLGGHAVTLIGWGVEADGTKYWTIQNSWNESWGENGNFRIVRGVDECGIESEGNGADAPAL